MGDSLLGCWKAEKSRTKSKRGDQKYTQDDNISLTWMYSVQEGQLPFAIALYKSRIE